MNIYLFTPPPASSLFHNDEYESFLEILQNQDVVQKSSYTLSKLETPPAHHDIIPLLEEREQGIILIPALWEDLFCIKLLNEIRTLPHSYAKLFYGQAPEKEHLITAFNAGIDGFISLPADQERVSLLFQKVINKHEEDKRRYARACCFDQVNYERIQSERHILGKAFKDLLHGRNPFALNNIRLLIVNSSSAQERRLSHFLTEVDASSESARSMSHALEVLQSSPPFDILISDYLLPDGDAIQLVKRMREQLKEEMPRVLVWSSSPEEIPALLQPETFIDDVILKPTPFEGIESLLPALFILLYQKKE